MAPPAMVSATEAGRTSVPLDPLACQRTRYVHMALFFPGASQLDHYKFKLWGWRAATPLPRQRDNLFNESLEKCSKQFQATVPNLL